MGMNYITPEQLLASLLSSASPAGGGGSGARRLLDALGVAPDALRAAALAKLKGDAEAEGERRGGGRQGGNGGGSSDATRAEGAKVLAELTRDLTAEAAEGGPDPVIGRSKEVARCVQILARRSKNNPILLGEPGVGKVCARESESERAREDGGREGGWGWGAGRREVPSSFLLLFSRTHTHAHRSPSLSPSLV